MAVVRPLQAAPVDMPPIQSGDRDDRGARWIAEASIGSVMSNVTSLDRRARERIVGEVKISGDGENSCVQSSL